MGTSAAYSGPTTPQWGEAKRDVTATCGKTSTPSSSDFQRVVGKHIRANGGPSKVARGKGAVGGRGGAASEAARSFGGFARLVAESGLQEALDEIGLADFVGDTPLELEAALVEHFAGPGSNHDEVDVRAALIDLFRELLEDATTNEEFEDALQSQFSGDGIVRSIQHFFGYVLFHEFSRLHFERVCSRHGRSKAGKFFNGVRSYILAEVEYLTEDDDPMSVEWWGDEGSSLAKEIHERTLNVFFPSSEGE